MSERYGRNEKRNNSTNTNRSGLQHYRKAEMFTSADDKKSVQPSTGNSTHQSYTSSTDNYRSQTQQYSSSFSDVHNSGTSGTESPVGTHTSQQYSSFSETYNSSPSSSEFPVGTQQPNDIHLFSKDKPTTFDRIDHAVGVVKDVVQTANEVEQSMTKTDSVSTSAGEAVVQTGKSVVGFVGRRIDRKIEENHEKFKAEVKAEKREEKEKRKEEKEKKKEERQKHKKSSQVLSFVQSEEEKNSAYSGIRNTLNTDISEIELPDTNDIANTLRKDVTELPVIGSVHKVMNTDVSELVSKDKRVEPHIPEKTETKTQQTESNVHKETKKHMQTADYMRKTAEQSKYAEMQSEQRKIRQLTENDQRTQQAKQQQASQEEAVKQQRQEENRKKENNDYYDRSADLAGAAAETAVMGYAVEQSLYYGSQTFQENEQILKAERVSDEFIPKEDKIESYKKEKQKDAFAKMLDNVPQYCYSDDNTESVFEDDDSIDLFDSSDDETSVDIFDIADSISVRSEEEKKSDKREALKRQKFKETEKRKFAKKISAGFVGDSSDKKGYDQIHSLKDVGEVMRDDSMSMYGMAMFGMPTAQTERLANTKISSLISGAKRMAALNGGGDIEDLTDEKKDILRKKFWKKLRDSSESDDELDSLDSLDKTIGDKTPNELINETFSNGDETVQGNETEQDDAEKTKLSKKLKRAGQQAFYGAYTAAKMVKKEADKIAETEQSMAKGTSVSEGLTSVIDDKIDKAKKEAFNEVKKGTKKAIKSINDKIKEKIEQTKLGRKLAYAKYKFKEKFDIKARAKKRISQRLFYEKQRLAKVNAYKSANGVGGGFSVAGGLKGIANLLIGGKKGLFFKKDGGGGAAAATVPVIAIIVVVVLIIAIFFSFLKPMSYKGVAEGYYDKDGKQRFIIDGEDALDFKGVNAKSEKEIIEGYLQMTEDYTTLLQAHINHELGDWSGGSYRWGGCGLRFECIWLPILKRLKEEHQKAVNKAVRELTAKMSEGVEVNSAEEGYELGREIAKACSELVDEMNAEFEILLEKEEKKAKVEWKKRIDKLNDLNTPTETWLPHEVERIDGENGKKDSLDFTDKPVPKTNFFGNTSIEDPEMTREKMLAYIMIYKSLKFVDYSKNGLREEEEDEEKISDTTGTIPLTIIDEKKESEDEDKDKDEDEDKDKDKDKDKEEEEAEEDKVYHYEITEKDIQDFFEETEYIHIRADITFCHKCEDGPCCCIWVNPGQKIVDNQGNVIVECEADTDPDAPGEGFFYYYCPEDHQHLEGEVTIKSEEELGKAIFEVTHAKDNGMNYSKSTVDSLIKTYLDYIDKTLKGENTDDIELDPEKIINGNSGSGSVNEKEKTPLINEENTDTFYKILAGRKGDKSFIYNDWCRFKVDYNCLTTERNWLGDAFQLTDYHYDFVDVNGKKTAIDPLAIPDPIKVQEENEAKAKEAESTDNGKDSGKTGGNGKS